MKLDIGCGMHKRDEDYIGVDAYVDSADVKAEMWDLPYKDNEVDSIWSAHTLGGKEVCLKHSDITDWNITFVDTGIRSNTGQRLKAVEKYLKEEEIFLTNYADGLTNLPLPDMIDYFNKSGKIGCFVCVKPSQTFHVVSLRDSSPVEKIEYVRETNITINGGYYVFKNKVFEYIKDGEELVVEPFQRLIKEDQLIGYKYDKFWHSMDTFKEQQELNDIFERGEAPWEVWKK